MNRFVLEFSKQGYIKYISHLDMLRLFKRTFKRAGIPLDYSKGFNPHPRMSFAQPLSLGYTSKQELIEFYTYEETTRDDILSKLNEEFPEGISIHACGYIDGTQGSLAAAVSSAVYSVFLPDTLDKSLDEINTYIESYLAKEAIIALKRMKKTKKLGEVDIRSKIRRIDAEDVNGNIVLKLDLDCGSASNLSPELVITTFIEHSGLNIQRYDIEVSRDFLRFDSCIPQTMGLDLIHEN